MAVKGFIDVRTWPERTDVIIVDPAMMTVLAQYPLDPVCEGPIWDICAPYKERANAAKEALLEDPEYLAASFHSGGEKVELIIDTSLRTRMDVLLKGAGLDLSQIEFGKIKNAETKLRNLEIKKLFNLLCAWHDVVERRHLGGASSSQSWTERSHPDNCHLYCYLIAGVDNAHAINDEEKEEAFLLLSELNDVDIKDLTFGHILRWIYYSRTEFSDLEYRSPAAI
jgi:hypothetical protein